MGRQATRVARRTDARWPVTRTTITVSSGSGADPDSAWVPDGNGAAVSGERHSAQQVTATAITPTASTSSVGVPVHHGAPASVLVVRQPR